MKEGTRKRRTAKFIDYLWIGTLIGWNGIKGVGSKKRGNGVESDRQSDDAICVRALLWEGGLFMSGLAGNVQPNGSE